MFREGPGAEFTARDFEYLKREIKTVKEGYKKNSKNRQERLRNLRKNSKPH